MNPELFINRLKILDTYFTFLFKSELIYFKELPKIYG